MNWSKFVIAWLALTGVLIIGGFAEAMVSGYGIANPVFSGITIPFVTAFILLILIIFVVRKYAKVDI